MNLFPQKVVGDCTVLFSATTQQQSDGCVLPPFVRATPEIYFGSLKNVLKSAPLLLVEKY